MNSGSCSHVVIVKMAYLKALRFWGSRYFVSSSQKYALVKAFLEKRSLLGI